jgi:hypothetical protein
MPVAGMECREHPVQYMDIYCPDILIFIYIIVIIPVDEIVLKGREIN